MTSTCRPGSAGDVDYQLNLACAVRMTEIDFGNEGPRRDTPPGDERPPSRWPEGQSPPLHRSGRRTEADGHRCRSGRRRRSKGNPRRYQAPVRPVPRPVPLRMQGNSRPKRKLQRSASVARKAAQPCRERQLRPHVPRGPSRQKTSLLFRRQLFDPFQVQLDTCCERPLHLIKRVAERRDVEVNAYRLPPPAGPVGVAAQREAHAGFREFRSHGHAIRCRHCTKYALGVPAPVAPGVG